MYNNDYIIAVDENGQPYIAHAYATDGKGENYGRGVRNARTLGGKLHAYLQKVKTKTGNWRYLYTPEEVAALGRRAAKRAWGSKAGRWIDDHDAGLSERLLANRQRRKAKQADKAGRHQEAEERRAKAMALYRESKDEGARAKRTLAAAPKRAWGSKAGRFIDEHDAGISERLMANYYRRKGAQADKSGRHQDAENYRSRAMSLYRESKDEGAAARERLRSLTTRKKKSEVSETSGSSSNQNTNDEALKRTIAKMSTQIKANPAIPKNSNVSDEYLLDMGFNSRVSSVNKFDAARDALTAVQRDYNRVSKLSSSSGEVRADKSDAQKALKKAQKEYDTLRQQVIDEINEKDYIERMSRLQR